MIFDGYPESAGALGSLNRGRSQEASKNGGLASCFLRLRRPGSENLGHPRRRRDDRRVYGGYNAGVCGLSPSLWGIHLADEPDVRPAGYPAEAIWEGLNLIPFYIAPHFRSDHVESAAIERTVAYYIDHKLPFVALRDGEAMTLNDQAPWEAWHKNSLPATPLAEGLRHRSLGQRPRDGIDDAQAFG